MAALPRTFAATVINCALKSSVRINDMRKEGAKNARTIKTFPGSSTAFHRVEADTCTDTPAPSSIRTAPGWLMLAAEINGLLDVPVSYHTEVSAFAARRTAMERVLPTDAAYSSGRM